MYFLTLRKLNRAVLSSWNNLVYIFFSSLLINIVIVSSFSFSEFYSTKLEISKKLKNVIRSHYGGNTRSHSNSEVKHHQACLVLRWGTTWEPYVLNNICIFVFFFSVQSVVQERKGQKIFFLQFSKQTNMHAEEDQSQHE